MVMGEEIIQKVLLGEYLRKKHPTKTLIKAIELTYGHKVNLKKLIELIETSPLSRRK